MMILLTNTKKGGENLGCDAVKINNQLWLWMNGGHLESSGVKAVVNPVRGHQAGVIMEDVKS